MVLCTRPRLTANLSGQELLDVNSVATNEKAIVVLWLVSCLGRMRTTQSKMEALADTRGSKDDTAPAFFFVAKLECHSSGGQQAQQDPPLLWPQRPRANPNGALLCARRF